MYSTDFLYSPVDSQMGRFIKQIDWTKTPLGSIEQWPQICKTAVGFILNSKFPMFLALGPELTFIYNDAYISALAPSKHLWALGRPLPEVWSEVWPVLHPMVDVALQKGKTTLAEDLCLLMKRDGYIEEAYFTLSYGPVHNDAGEIVGLSCVCTETTERILTVRRLTTLNDLSAKALVEKTPESACASAAKILARNLIDLPFTLLYLVDENGESAVLTQTTGLPKDSQLFYPVLVDLKSSDQPSLFWPLYNVIKTAQPQLVSVTALEELLPVGLSGQPVAQALILPLIISEQEKPIGILIAGINPCRKLNEPYQKFYTVVTRQITTAIQNSRIHEQ